MEKNVIKLNENTIRKIVAESVKKVLKEGLFNPAYVIFDEHSWYVGDQKDYDYIKQTIESGDSEGPIMTKACFSYESALEWGNTHLVGLEHEEDTYGTQW